MSSERTRTWRSRRGVIVTRTKWSTVAESTAPPCSSYQWGKSVPPPTQLTRSGAPAWIGPGSACMGGVSLGVTGRTRSIRWRRGSGTEGRPPARWRSGHLALQASALLLGEASPDAVAFAVLECPREAFLADPARGAERERRTRLLLADREEDVGIDPEACSAVLPEVRWGWVGRQQIHVDAREPVDPHRRNLPLVHR